MECRITAEDPVKFYPSAGKITKWIAPGGGNVRLDTHAYAGYVVPMFYDSMIGKLIVWGKNRKEAIARMSRALDEFCIEGIKTTIAFHQEMMKNELVFGLGPAGTGKTYLAVALAVSMMLEGRIDKIILSRPAVEAGENLGFLPGDLKEKVDPYLRPLYDALYEMLPAEQVDKKIAIGEIEIAPLAFMRGRTLSNAFVILDEAQNTTPMQMKMFLTRLGENSRMVVNGDLSQVDLPRGTISGLRDALETLKDTPSISSVRFNATDVVRHGLVAKIVKAYEEKSKKEYGDE